MTFTVQPIAGKEYDGFQWGWRVVDEYGNDYLHASTGGTGPCWNVCDPEDNPEVCPFHACEIDELIAALQALRESEAYRLNEERWA